MEHSEFKIGGAFWCGGRQWRCTDIGRRTIVAISLDYVEVGGNSPERRCVLGRAEADAEGWFNGPPYAVTETCSMNTTSTAARRSRRKRPNKLARLVRSVGAPTQSHWKHAKKSVIVMNYPKAIKGFMPVNDDGPAVAAMDVLAPGIGEIIGGSQREERLEVLDRCMAERGIDREHYAWYRDLRRYGAVPHAGFGLGFERTLAYVTGLANVRDAIPFPRTPGNARY